MLHVTSAIYTMWSCAFGKVLGIKEVPKTFAATSLWLLRTFNNASRTLQLLVCTTFKFTFINMRGWSNSGRKDSAPIIQALTHNFLHKLTEACSKLRMRHVQAHFTFSIGNVVSTILLISCLVQDMSSIIATQVVPTWIFGHWMHPTLYIFLIVTCYEHFY